jgi:predicted nucleic acid-binding protein
MRSSKIAKNESAKSQASACGGGTGGFACRSANILAPALAVLEELLRRKHRGFISPHGLTEIYSVPPLYPSEAWQIIEQMILPHLELITLTPKEYKEMVRHCAVSGWIGGRIHDTVHLRCAQKAECDRIYTFNVKDFRSLAPSTLEGKIAAP